MKIMQINSTYGMGSTGKICKDISEMLSENDIENYALYTVGKSDAPNAIKCSHAAYTKAQALKSRICGNYGFNSALATKKMIRELEIIKPDIVHLHNIHSHDCNLEMLFAYFKKYNHKIVWTFHDCWAFTAYCPHFTMIHCEKWKTSCKNCPAYPEYSFVFDRSEQLFQKKRTLFAGLDLTIITPSQWLANLVKQSFLKDYPIEVINNGIDFSVFKPSASYFREKHGILNDQKVLLGVAFGWGEKKGLDVFAELANRLNPNQYRIVLTGTDDLIDKQLPDNIISIHRTQNQQELAEIYSMADFFINPTREEVLGLVNLEALACGTPVITFNTGGSPEIIDENCGSIVDVDNIDALVNEIIYVCEKRPYSTENCISRAKLFDKNKQYKEYLKLYQRVIL